MSLKEYISESEWEDAKPGMSSARVLVPAGIYPAVIFSAELSPTSKGDGVKLITRHTITEGEFEGETVDHLFNIKNPNETAQRIGRGELKTLSLAVGLTDRPDEESELFDKAHLIKVVVEKSEQINPNTGEPYENSKIKGFYAVDKAPKVKHQKAVQTVAKRDAAKAEVSIVEILEEDDLPF